MTTILPTSEESGEASIWHVTRLYQFLLIVGFALTPSMLIAYLAAYQEPGRVFSDPLFLELSVLTAIIEGAFVCYLTYRCYLTSGEPVLRWLTLAFLGFSLIYVMQGAFSGVAQHHLWLYRLYGPAGRLVLAVLLFLGMLAYRRPAPADPLAARTSPRFWLSWVALFLAIDVAVALIATWELEFSPYLRVPIEAGAALFSVASLAIMAIRRIRSPLMTIYAVSIAAFGQASVAYLLAEPWNHMWWLAQATSAGGIFLLSYGVVLSFHTTRSFASIYSQEELMANIASAAVRTEQALKELQFAHSELERLAATDALTGVFNRRQFMLSVKVEIARAKRENTPLSLLALDLDKFKVVNDTYGHLAGDEVLKAAAKAFIAHVRPTDIIARIGGEEFVVLLPKVALGGASNVAERIRGAIEALAVPSGEHIIRPTVSIGVAQFGADGEELELVLAAGDKRLYIAKEAGRNRVIASGP